MKHPKFKGVGTLDAEIEKCEKNLLNKEIEFNWIVQKLKSAGPSLDNINKLRQQLRAKEKQVIKARKQVKAKKDQKSRKVNERQRTKFGGQAKKKERLALNRAINKEMDNQENILSQLKNIAIEFPSDKEEPQSGTELFISHASEDKTDFVKPLADELIKLGVSVWYDEYTLRIGDSLRRSIDQGLAESKYGLIILSKAFFEKNWTQYELNGLVVREMEGDKVILPIWHNITKDEIMKLSPSLVDKVALNSTMFTIREIAEKVADAVKNA
ncbi:toll/interleukin-1 receptor domain-containing protein [Vibrio vulnificus]|uniref:toll/interleukin-1 receptor domain-containing protein n=1 Tax=Vibrio vulnificus TaxID=672 RepID=UPI001A2586FE|nr:TIR domain-containing protein [Vibrio vulnificus]MCA0772364.1 TIR domain-containing protein [Vibrio vulnificus]HAS6244501.1 TIR domain-containing protein [Vibrio vulnificus]HDY7947022.1 TIR domain-containing protein [Vibrio vulnificus]